MANNKFVLRDGTVLLDLTSDTVTANKVLQGYTAHDRSGAAITGTYSGGGTGDLAQLKTMGYTAGNNRIENLAVMCQPFIAGTWSGNLSDNVKQGTNGIEFDLYGYAKMLFTGNVWDISATFNVSQFTTLEFSCLLAAPGVGIDFRTTTQRIYYTAGENKRYKPEKISNDVVDSSIAYCLEDTGFTSTEVLNNNLTISLEKDSSYLTVYLNNSPRIRVQSSVIDSYTEYDVTVGSVVANVHANGFKGEVIAFTIA